MTNKVRVYESFSLFIMRKKLWLQNELSVFGHFGTSEIWGEYAEAKHGGGYLARVLEAEPELLAQS